MMGDGTFMFASCAKNYAARFLEHDDFDFLNEAQKEYILGNLSDGLRVQDPSCHSPAQIVFAGEGAEAVRDAVLALGAEG